MADAFAAYYLSHKEGRDLGQKEICKVFDAAVAVGDCNAESDEHHGTPAQRECAAMWGANLADKVKRRLGKGLKVVEPSDFVHLFDRNLDAVLSLDSKICPENDECSYLQESVKHQISITAHTVLN